jgi:phosphonate transport system substrate-binding protein
MNNQFVFAHDTNLGFPVDTPQWQSFFQRHQIKVAGYECMDKMVADTQKDIPTIAFLPVGGAFYLNDSEYQSIVSATVGTKCSTQMTSYLVVKKDSEVNSLEQLKNKTLSYINLSCTTSYFAPALLLAEKGYTLNNFFKELIPVDGFAALLESVVSGKADSTMIWQRVWQEHPELAAQVNIIDELANLPTPIIIIKKEVDESLKQGFLQELLASPPMKGLFSGFVPYQKEQTELFLDKLRKLELGRKLPSGAGAFSSRRTDVSERREELVREGLTKR